MSKLFCRGSALLFILGAWAYGPLAARAQFITDFNSLIENDYHFFCCTSDLAVTNNYPTSAIIDDDYTATSGGIHFTNRHDLIFSSDGGATPRQIDSTDSFDLSFDIKLEAGAISPRKEAGIFLDTGGGSQFIVNTDSHEIVVFGGFQPFYSFNTNFGISYNAGDTINMREVYYGKTASTPGKFQYIVKKDGTTYSSPVIDSPAGEMGILDNSTLMVYLQGKAASAADFARATFTNFQFGTGPGVPGDYNNNGVVDAADYVLWRKGGTLANDPTPGLQPADYDFWRAHFGAPPGSGSSLGASSTVPEPSGMVLFFTALVAAHVALGRVIAANRSRAQ
jgi:hypothetical protein